MNLLTNAVKYTNSGRITLKINCDIVGDCAIWHCSVKDTGIGIAPDHTERVFERFYRVDKSRSKQSGGTGLGLSIVKHIAASFGGTITLNSTLGEGTEITVTFNK